MEKNTNRVVVTAVGKDTKGIIAAVSTALAERDINILDISQTILQEFFTMIMVVDMTDCQISFSNLKEELGLLGQKHGVVISCQHEEIFQYMHRI
ncbi:MAG: ACT domain-containing protein [Peptococcaceae bacterium]|nr:ACT domain-containing protein [Peptococcaceae bacterium]